MTVFVDLWSVQTFLSPVCCMLYGKMSTANLKKTFIFLYSRKNNNYKQQFALASLKGWFFGEFKNLVSRQVHLEYEFGSYRIVTYFVYSSPCQRHAVERVFPSLAIHPFAFYYLLPVSAIFIGMTLLGVPFKNCICIWQKLPYFKLEHFGDNGKQNYFDKTSSNISFISSKPANIIHGLFGPIFDQVLL